jgi:hypothetical protein
LTGLFFLRYAQRMEEQTLLQRIVAKEAEITNYERILRQYAARGGGRWYDQGRRHLEALRAEHLILVADAPSVE